MMRLPVAALCTVAVALSLAASPLFAQNTVNLDQVIGRARALVEAGNGRAGRALLDSLGQQLTVGTPALGELLYWRGLLSESSVDAERDWRRLLLEVPRSPRAEDALLRLAQLELLRGNPAKARPLLDRMARDYSSAPSRARAYFWMAKAWFEEQDTPRACGAVQAAQRNVPTRAVELRTQLADLNGQCAGVTVVALEEVGGSAVVERVAQAAAPAPAPAPAPDPEPVTAASTRPADARFSVQLAAWARLDQAQRMVRQLAADGIDARVDGTVRPFRVRTGYFRTRAEASRRLAEFTRAGREGFVAELTP